jgi:AbrB family looped-hinge helix DNA binding protein
MEVTIDEYGRIVIPKPIRDRLGLDAGTALELDVDADDPDTIRLAPKGREPTLQRKGDLLVHTGRLTDDTFDVVEQLRRSRAERASKHAGLQT